MVVTQAAHGHALPVSLQFPSDIAVLAAVVGLQRETTVSPQLALYGNGVASAAARPARPHESDRSKESGEAISRHDACGSRSASRVALADASAAADAVADRAVRPGDELRVPGSCLKENIVPSHMHPTQNGKRMSQGLDGVRKAAKERKQERFTALLHHVSIELLRESFYVRESFYTLQRKASPGIDGVTFNRRW
jgi:hypothetical protein